MRNNLAQFKPTLFDATFNFKMKHRLFFSVVGQFILNLGGQCWIHIDIFLHLNNLRFVESFAPTPLPLPKKIVNHVESQTRQSHFIKHRLPTISHRKVASPIPISGSKNADSIIDQNETTKESENDITKKQRVVVIGAGVGGLATAARILTLAKSSNKGDGLNLEVLILEKNEREYLGGRCGSLDVEIDGMGTWRHERGPSLLLLKEEYERLFEDCGTRRDQSASGKTAAELYGLTMKQCIPAYQVVFDDGDTVQLGFPQSTESSTNNEYKEMEQDLSIDKLNSFEPNGAAKWKDYLDTCAAFLDCGLPNFIEERLDLGSFPAFLAECFKDGGKRWPLNTHSSLLDSIFSSPKLCALASFQDLYVGLEPYTNSNQIGGGVLRKTAPAVFGLLSALELHATNSRAGVFAPIGGFRQVSESMYQLCLDCGAKFQFGTSVTHANNEGVYFVTKLDDGSSEQGFIAADLVISNADLPYSKETIFSDKTVTKATEKESYCESFDWDNTFDFSSGVIAFHWSISNSLENLNTHNVFMSANSREDAERSWDVVRHNSGDNMGWASSLIDGGPFNFYVHRAGKTDASAAPPGCDSIMVLVPCPVLSRVNELALLPRDEAIGQYELQFGMELVSLVRDAVLKRLAVLDGLDNLKDFIVHEFVETPSSYAGNYNLGAGVPFGLSHGLSQLSIFRPGAQSESHPDVLHCGASNRPGNGIPLVLIGAKGVAKKALEKLTQKSK